MCIINMISKCQFLISRLSSLLVHRDTHNFGIVNTEITACECIFSKKSCWHSLPGAPFGSIKGDTSIVCQWHIIPVSKHHFCLDYSTSHHIPSQRVRKAFPNFDSSLPDRRDLMAPDDDPFLELQALKKIIIIILKKTEWNWPLNAANELLSIDLLAAVCTPYTPVLF